MIVVIATMVHLDSGNGRGAKEPVQARRIEAMDRPDAKLPPTWAKGASQLRCV